MHDTKKLFVDMDGTLAVFKSVDTLETLYEEGYFYNLAPNMNVVDAVRNIVKSNEGIEVYVLSSVLSDSKYALEEKNRWLDRYLPEIGQDHRLFPSCGDVKSEYIKDRLGRIDDNDYLLDDYSLNLHDWDPPAKGIKLMNGINGNHGSWVKDKVHYDIDGDTLAGNIIEIIKGNGADRGMTNDVSRDSVAEYRRKSGR